MDIDMDVIRKKNLVAGRCNALKQARQTLVRTVAIANKRTAANKRTPPISLTQEQEAELQACAVIIGRVESSLWSQWNKLDKQ